MIVALLCCVLSAQDAKVLEKYRNAVDQFNKGAYAEAIRLCEEAAKEKPDKEGVLRVRVGAGYDDKEFEPRRLAGDAFMKQAEIVRDAPDKLKQVESAIRWYQASSDLKLEKAAALLAAATKEKERLEAEIRKGAQAGAFQKILDATRAAVMEQVAARAYETAYGELEKAKPGFAGNEAAWAALKSDVDQSFQRWHDGLVAELAQDLESFKPATVVAEPKKLAERFERYRVKAETAVPSKRHGSLGWAVRLAEACGSGLDGPALEKLAAEGLAFGVIHWRLVEGVVLESLASAVRDPGASAAIEERWAAVDKAEGPYRAASSRGRAAVEAALKEAKGARKDELERWLEADLAGFDRRVAEVRRGLPDRDAPKAVAAVLAKLDDAEAGSTRDGYAAIERELKELASTSKLDAPLEARLLAGVAIARASALYLRGATREQVLESAGEAFREARRRDEKAFDGWPQLSPRLQWVVEKVR
jgi:hypothetical protein